MSDPVQYIDPQVRAARINTWTTTLTERLAARHPNSATTFALDKRKPGQRWVRLVCIDGAVTRSVHAFIDWETGDVYKAAGWKAPAKHIRFSLRDDESFARMIEVCDPFGGYLYIR
jgi:hypothetical protein